MKLIQMKTKNFRSLADRTWDFSKNMALVGSNGSGKSSFLEAVNYAVNGTPAKDAVRRGSSEMSVSLTLGDGNGTKITRFCCPDEVFALDGVEVLKADFLSRANELFETHPGAFSIIPSATNHIFLACGKDTLEEFLLRGTCTGIKIPGRKELGVSFPDGSTLYRYVPGSSRVEVNGRKTTSKSVDEVVLNGSGAFPGAFRIALNSEMVRGMESSDIGRWLLGILPVTVTSEKACDLAGFTDEEKEEALSWLPKDPQPVSMADIDQLSKRIRAERAQINARIKETTPGTVFQGMLPVMDVASASGEMDLAASKEAEYEAALRARETVKAVLEKEEQRKRSIEEMKQKLSSLPEGEDIPEEEIKKAQELIQEYDQSIQLAERMKAMAQSSVQDMEQSIKKLETNACPLCPDLVCRTDRSSLIKELVEKKKAYLLQKKDAEEQSSMFRIKRTEATDTLSKLTGKAQAFLKRQELSNFIRKMEQLSPPEIQKIPDSTVTRSEIDLLKKRACRHMEEAVSFERAMQAGLLLKELREKSLYYTRLLAKCDPKSGDLVRAVLEYILEPVKNHMNETASMIWPDLSIEFITGPDGLQIYMKPHDRNAYIAMENLSRGERTLLSFLLMDILSQLSGSRMIAFDNIEALDGEALDHLLEVTGQKEMQERYDHIFLSAVSHDSILSILSKHPQFTTVGVG